MSEFVKKDTFVQTQKELYKCVSLTNSSRKTHLYRRRNSCTNVYLCRIHQERHICTCAERAVQMCISVRIHQERHICTGAERAVQMCISVEFIEKDTFVQAKKELYKCVSLSEFIKKDTFVQMQKELYKCVSLSNSSGKTHLYRCKKNCTNLCPNSSRKTHLYRRRKSCTNVYLCRIRQERHICTNAERALQMCISVEFIKKDTFVQAQQELYKCVSLSNSSRKTHLYRRRENCTNVYLCQIHQERHICTGAERAVQMCISVEFIRKDTFVQVLKQLYKCVSLSNSSRKIHLYRHRNSCTNVYLCRILQERHICTGTERAVEIYVRIHQERHICTEAERAVQMSVSVKFIKKDTFVQTQKELYKCVSLSNSSRKTQLHKRRKTCTNVYLCRDDQERHSCTDAERAVQMCISVKFIEKDTFVQEQKDLYKCVSLSEFIKKDTFVETQKELFKCVSLSNSSGKTHLYRWRKSFTNVYLCRIHQERYICTGAERALQMCISVEFIRKDTFVQVLKQRYKCVSLSNS